VSSSLVMRRYCFTQFFMYFRSGFPYCGSSQSVSSPFFSELFLVLILIKLLPCWFHAKRWCFDRSVKSTLQNLPDLHRNMQSISLLLSQSALKKFNTLIPPILFLSSNSTLFLHCRYLSFLLRWIFLILRPNYRKIQSSPCWLGEIYRYLGWP
jgi:hypothetical protein